MIRNGARKLVTEIDDIARLGLFARLYQRLPMRGVETAQQQYYKTQQTNYDKVEAIFNDSGNTGVKNALTEFYNAWNDLSTNASTASNRTAVIEKSNVLADRIKTASQQLQAQQLPSQSSSS